MQKSSLAMKVHGMLLVVITHIQLKPIISTCDVTYVRKCACVLQAMGSWVRAGTRLDPIMFTQ